MARPKIVLSWVLQVLCGLLFVVIGVAKFGDPAWARHFERWGYPSGFFMAVGVVEAIGGLALFWPRTAFHSAVMLMTIMAAAFLTHLRAGETGRLSGPLLYFGVLAAIAWLRRPARKARSAIVAPRTAA